MLKDRGKILKERIHKFSAESGLSITKIAERAGYDQSMPYRHFAKPDLADHILLKYGRVIQYDFSNDFPEMQQYILNEPTEGGYTKNSKLEKCEEERDGWREKYIALLEKHNAMLFEMLEKERQVFTPETQVAENQ